MATNKHTFVIALVDVRVEFGAGQTGKSCWSEAKAKVVERIGIRAHHRHLAKVGKDNGKCPVEVGAWEGVIVEQCQAQHLHRLEHWQVCFIPVQLGSRRAQRGSKFG